MCYSEEEIKTETGTFNGAVFRRKKYIIPDTPPEYMPCSSFCLKHSDIPEELLKVFPKISIAISSMEETFHTIKKSDKSLKKLLKFNDKRNQLKVERVGIKGQM